MLRGVGAGELLDKPVVGVGARELQDRSELVEAGGRGAGGGFKLGSAKARTTNWRTNTVQPE